ncbi:MAG: phage major capsid protein [Gemmatimonadaceae bacterium]|nr:phage major capsid protein [Gemmatimonadaceae bacterium]
MASLTIEELEARQSEIKGRLKEIDTEFAGETFPDETRAEWNGLNEEHDRSAEIIGELRARKERVAVLAGSDRHVERPVQPAARLRVGSGVPDDIYAVDEYRNRASNRDDLRSALRSGAKKAVEVAVFPHEQADRAAVQEHLVRLLNTIDGDDGELSRRILQTGSPLYARAFGKALAGAPLTSDEQRALSESSAGGGYAVPFVLDPTIIPTSNGSVNPLRQISRVETITTNEWRGVSSGGITAAYSAEATETTDNAPTLGQPTATPAKAQAFIPFSIEIGQDWGSLQTEMAKLLQAAKDDLEATKFVTGTGTNEPEGLLVGATAVVTSVATSAFAVADVYALADALPNRWQPRASFLGNRAQFTRVRQFDTNGGSNLWARLADRLPDQLIGYPAYQQSTYDTSGTAAGASILTIGDFSNFLIVDRVGLNVELIPHLFGTVANFPTGQRGLYAYWRNTSKVLAWQAFRTLKLG